MIALLDFITGCVSLWAFGVLAGRFRRPTMQRDAKFVLAGFLLLMGVYHFCLFLEWSGWGDSARFDRIENFIGTLTPMAWFLVVYAMVKELSAGDLKKSEEKLRAFLDHHVQFTAIVDPEGRLILANQAALKSINAKADEVAGKLFWESPWWSGDGGLKAELMRLFQSAATGKLSRAEVEVRTAKGSLRNFDISMNPFFDNYGKLQWLVIEGRDITDLRKAQALAKETLEFSKAILFKVDIQSQGFEYVSPYIESVTGFAPRYFIEGGMRWLDGRLHPEDRQRLNRLNQDIARRGVGEGSDVEYELRICGRDDTFDWYRARNTIRFNANGKAESVIGILERITEQKRAELVLRNYEQIVSHTGDLLALVNDRYVFQAVNNAYLACFGKTSAQLIGREMAAVEGDHHFMNVTRAMADRCLAGEEVHYQTQLTMPKGEQIVLDINYYPHTDAESDAIIGFVISARDITAQRQLEEQLHQARKMEAIGTLAGGIAHDFNNILSAILGYSELGLSPKEPKETLVEYMHEIQKAGKRAGDLVRQILTFSRQTPQEAQPLLVKATIAEALKFMRASLPATISIKAKLFSDAYVLADPTQLHQIVMNLAANAAYAMRSDGGVLEVSLEDCELDQAAASQHVDVAAGAYIRLAVADTGTGIPQKIVNRIFDPFFTTKPKDEGTGMGLSVVHGIVKAYHGFIAVASEPGQGTVFNIFLPKMPGNATRPPDTALEKTPCGRESLLLVDDESSIVAIGQKVLEGLGYRVTATSSSLEAIRLFEANSDAFDLVLTDMTMPDLAGDRLAEAMLKIRPDIPIILVTGIREASVATNMQTPGFKKVIYKPVVKHDLAMAIRDVLDRRV